MILEASLVIDENQFDFLFNYMNLKNRINWNTILYNYSYTGPLYITYNEEYFDLFRDMAFTATIRNPFSRFSRLEAGIIMQYLEKKRRKI